MEIILISYFYMCYFSVIIYEGVVRKLWSIGVEQERC